MKQKTADIISAVVKYKYPIEKSIASRGLYRKGCRNIYEIALFKFLPMSVCHLISVSFQNFRLNAFCNFLIIILIKIYVKKILQKQLV